MLSRVSYENFKCFEKVEISPSKITLLTGANSSGKSSMIYGILGAIQSGNFPFQFSPNGKYIRMGDYKEIVFSHDLSKKIKLNFIFTSKNLQHNISTVWTKDKNKSVPILDELVAKSKFYRLSMKKILKYDLEFEAFEGIDGADDFMDPSKLIGFMDSVTSLVDNDKEDEKSKQEAEKMSVAFRKYYNSKKSKVSTKIKDIDEYRNLSIDKRDYYLDQVISKIKDLFRGYNRSLNFISSFRLYPQRTYYEGAKADLKVGRFGENYEDQIIAWEASNNEKYRQLLKIIKELGLFQEVKTNRLDGGRYEILIKSKKNGVWSALSDVGFGVSQFLPIIVADLQLGKNSTLFVAQPEIHLHPEVQAKFADYVIDNISNGDKRYVIETHSEYLINRLRLAIAEKKINEKDVYSVFFQNNGKKARKYQMQFKKDGRILKAPKGFFETYMLDVMNIAIAAE